MTINTFIGLVDMPKKISKKEKFWYLIHLECAFFLFLFLCVTHLILTYYVN